jgi:hypothetical protein
MSYSLPTLPEKKVKFSKSIYTSLISPCDPDICCGTVVDHTDPAFLATREHALQTYLTALIRIPHVTDLVSTKAFIGLMEKVRETSMIFTTPTIGVTLIPCDSPGTPAVVGFIQASAVTHSWLASRVLTSTCFIHRIRRLAPTFWPVTS